MTTANTTIAVWGESKLYLFLGQIGKKKFFCELQNFSNVYVCHEMKKLTMADAELFAHTMALAV